ncbi:LOW QUALITY PROTEIN: C-type lectin domain family 4 member K-like [Palaemon carinicauda]|uniref:LOW QUALITY PROTEIN: C-type lectin domain family 4 member K-like n=1 Tax=Palaemon carinicauda TaxID=392227 RepID=UPI0035B5DB26
MSSMPRCLITITCLTILIQGPLGAIPPVQGESPLCGDEFAAALKDISEAITSTSRTCSRDGPREKNVFGVETELITQTLRQNSDSLSSLLAQSENLKLAMTSVAEVQNAQQHMVAALRSELESEKTSKRNLRRTVHDLRSELHTVKEESKAWREHLSRLESEIKAGLQKSELASQEATIEVKSTGERVDSLGEVIRNVQGSLQGLEKTVNRHTSNLVALRKKASRPLDRTEKSEETAVDSSAERPDENIHCPHPYTRIGLGCFTVHSTQRYSWERARQHCDVRNSTGILANPYDLYDVVLFLDESFPESVYSTSGSWGFWVGATLKDDGKWHWVSGLPVDVQVDFWGRGEPGDPLENDERCLFLHSWWRFRAGADSCDNKKYFICELKV